MIKAKTGRSYRIGESSSYKQNVLKLVVSSVSEV